MSRTPKKSAEALPTNRQTYLPVYQQILLLIVGFATCSWGFTAFFVTNDLISGGLPGLSLLTLQTLGWNISITQWVIGIILFAVAWKLLGWKDTARSLLGSLILPATIWLAGFAPGVPVDNKILAALFGGALLGIGLALIFRANYTVGGFSLVARILLKYFKIPMYQTMLVLDGIVLLLSGIFIDSEVGLLGLVSVFAMGKTIDLIQTGANTTASVTIVTQKAEQLRPLILQELNSGATIVPAEGAHSQQPSTIILTVIPRSKVADLKRLIRQVDPQSFAIVSQTSEVLGYGFNEWQTK